MDFKDELDYLYKPSSNDFTMVTVPALRYLMIDGQGDPNTSLDYQNSLEALYSVAYSLKFTSKKDLGKDYVVPPLEGLWWADDMSAFTQARKNEWKWTMMIMVPTWIDKIMVKKSIQVVSEKKTNSKLSKIRIEALKEGKSVQIMHIGSFADEAPVLNKLHREYLPNAGFALNGKHHEIYLSDPRKTESSKLRTIIRQPVKKSSKSV